MLKSLALIVASVSIATAVIAEPAQAKGWTCAMTITKGGCPMPVYLPEPPKPLGD